MGWRQNINMTGLEFGEAAKRFRHQRMRVFKAIRFGPQNNDGKRQVLNLLLVRQAFVHREEDIEFAGVGNKAQKLAVLDARPTRARNSLDFVSGQIAPQTRRQTFVEQDAHSGRGEQALAGLFQKGNRLPARDRGVLFQKLVERLAALEVIQQRPHGNARAGCWRVAGVMQRRCNGDVTKGLRRALGGPSMGLRRNWPLLPPHPPRCLPPSAAATV